MNSKTAVRSTFPAWTSPAWPGASAAMPSRSITEYQLAKDLIVFTHTEVDPAYAGQGVGSALARHELEDVSDIVGFLISDQGRLDHRSEHRRRWRDVLTAQQYPWTSGGQDVF